MKKAKIIVIEGTDGSGKETQSKLLYNYLIESGYKVKCYSFPIYDSPTGKIVGGPYLGKEEISKSYFEETSANVDAYVSSLYFAADRRYNFINDISKELNKNDFIILDRYTTSNMGHQACKTNNDKDMNKILNFIEKLEFDLLELPRPDIVLFLYMPLLATKELRKGRSGTDGNESNDEYLQKAEKTYVKIAKKYKWTYLNCIKGKEYNGIESIKSIDEISNDIKKIINDYIGR